MNEPAKRYRTPESFEKPTLEPRWAAPWLPPFELAAGPKHLARAFASRPPFFLRQICRIVNLCGRDNDRA